VHHTRNLNHFSNQSRFPWRNFLLSHKAKILASWDRQWKSNRDRNHRTSQTRVSGGRNRGPIGCRERVSQFPLELFRIVRVRGITARAFDSAISPVLIEPEPLLRMLSDCWFNPPHNVCVICWGKASLLNSSGSRRPTMYRPSGCNNVLKGWRRAFVRLWRVVCIIVTRIRRPNARIITPGCDIFMVRSAKIPTDVPRKSIFRKRITDNS
jgi:hypothetical protein